MRKSVVSSVLSRSLAVAALSVGLTAGSAAVVVLSAAPVSAEVTAGDFTDPVTGKLDLAAYLAAVAAENGRSTVNGSLPSTGSDPLELVAGGVAIAVAGGAAIVLSKRGLNRIHS